MYVGGKAKRKYLKEIEHSRADSGVNVGRVRQCQSTKERDGELLDLKIEHKLSQPTCTTNEGTGLEWSLIKRKSILRNPFWHK